MDKGTSVGYQEFVEVNILRYKSSRESESKLNKTLRVLMHIDTDVKSQIFQLSAPAPHYL